MPTPTLTVRLAPEHHALVRAIAAALKTDAALAGRLRAVLQLDEPDAPEAAPAPDALADALRRIEVLEAHVADLRGKAGRQAKVSSQERRLIVAAGLEGVMTRQQYGAQIGVSNPTLTRWVKRGMPVREDGLLDVEAVERWRRENEARLLAEKVPG